MHCLVVSAQVFMIFRAPKVHLFGLIEDLQLVVDMECHRLAGKFFLELAVLLNQQLVLLGEFSVLLHKVFFDRVAVAGLALDVG